MSQNFLVNGFMWVENASPFKKYFIKTYAEENDEGHFLEVDIQSPAKLHEVHNDLPFLLERMKIEKVEKPVATLHGRKEYVIHTNRKS